MKASQHPLSEAGLYGRTAVKKPQMKKKNCVKRLQWAKEHKHWTIDQWNKVFWPDESKFEIFGSNKSVYVRRRVDERAATLYITPIVKHGKGSVLVWEDLPIGKSGIRTR